MGLWLHTHIVTTTAASPDLQELAEVQPHASVQTMPLCFGCGCRTFQTASHVHGIHIWEVWVPSQVVDRQLLHIHIVTSTDTSPDLGELAEILPDASVQTMPQQGCRTFQTASHVYVIHIWDVWAPSQVADGHMASHSHRNHHRCFCRFARVCWNPTWCKCANILLCFGWGCRNLQTASHVHAIHMRCLSAFLGCGGCMVSHSHHYHHSHFPRFERFGWNPTWYKCANHATTHWLRLQNLANCIQCPCDTYMPCLSTLSGCGWAYGFTLTP